MIGFPFSVGPGPLGPVVNVYPPVRVVPVVPVVPLRPCGGMLGRGGYPRRRRNSDTAAITGSTRATRYSFGGESGRRQSFSHVNNGRPTDRFSRSRAPSRGPSRGTYREPSRGPSRGTYRDPFQGPSRTSSRAPGDVSGQTRGRNRRYSDAPRSSNPFSRAAGGFRSFVQGRSRRQTNAAAMPSGGFGTGPRGGNPREPSQGYGRRQSFSAISSGVPDGGPFMRGGLGNRGETPGPFNRPSSAPRHPSGRHGRQAHFATRSDQPNTQQGGGKYVVVKALKTGGMSTKILLIQNPETGTLYVEKHIKAAGRHARRARAEVETLHKARGHPNLCQVVECNPLRNGQFSIIMEFYEGGNLRERIRECYQQQKPFIEISIWNMLLEVSKGLAFLHYGIRDVNNETRGEWDTICHLDLKPENIFIRNELNEYGQRRLVLADFGCAIPRSMVTRGIETDLVQECGTPAWYPPEGLRALQAPLAGGGRSAYCTKTDLFMLGASAHAAAQLLSHPNRALLASGSPCGSFHSRELNHIVNELVQNDYQQRPNAIKVAYAAKQFLRVLQRNQR